MTANEKRDLLVRQALTRQGKNQYSQDSKKRIKIESGYGDCSGTVWYWYNKLFGINIGGNTEAQIKSTNGDRVNLTITKGIPDESKMKKGDLLYFRGTDNSRTDGVGHVENGIEDALTMDDNMTDTDRRTATGTTGDYQATRTADMTRAATGTNNTIMWVWLILAVASIVIISLVWYYGSQNRID